MQRTENFNFYKPEATDFYSIDHQNLNWDTVDEKLAYAANKCINPVECHYIDITPREGAIDYRLSTYLRKRNDHFELSNGNRLFTLVYLLTPQIIRNLGSAPVCFWGTGRNADAYYDFPLARIGGESSIDSTKLTLNKGVGFYPTNGENTTAYFDYIDTVSIEDYSFYSSGFGEIEELLPTRFSRIPFIDFTKDNASASISIGLQLPKVEGRYPQFWVNLDGTIDTTNSDAELIKFLQDVCIVKRTDTGDISSSISIFNILEDAFAGIDSSKQVANINYNVGECVNPYKALVFVKK